MSISALDVIKKQMTSSFNDGTVKLSRNQLNQSLLLSSRAQSTGRLEVKPVHNLGPGQYNIMYNKSVLTNRRKTISQRIERNLPQNPSPGRYDTNKTTLSTNGAGISTSHGKIDNRKMPLKTVPGPGEYNPRFTRSSSQPGTIRKNFEIPKAPTPSPGDYPHLPKSTQIPHQPSSFRDQVPSNRNYAADLANTPGPQLYGSLKQHFGQTSIPVRYVQYVPSYMKNPGPYNTAKSDDFLNTSKQKGATIGAKFVDKRYEKNEEQQKQVILNERIAKLAAQRKRKLETQLQQQIKLGEKALQIGMEGKWASKEERKKEIEKTAVYRTFLTEDEFVVHFSLAGPDHCKYASGLLHGRILVNRVYPHSNFEIEVLSPESVFQKIDLGTKFHRQWNVTMGVHVILNELYKRFEEFIQETNLEKLYSAAQDSVVYICKECGARHENLILKLQLNKSAFKPWTDPAIAQKLGISDHVGDYII